MLAPFGIRPKTIWPPRRGSTDKSVKGYYRAAFEAAWASYCDGTPAQRSNITVLVRCLGRHGFGTGRQSRHSAAPADRLSA